MKGSWYNQFVNAELAEIGLNVLHSTYSPYGRGTDSYAPIIALGESWAYHMGHFMADMRYGDKSTSPQYEQPFKPAYTTTTTSGSVTTTISSHINVLELFDPNYTTDPFHWIPQGLYEDLRDATNETIPVKDVVSNYTNSQMFNAFSSSITTLQGYRTNLLNTTTNPTSTSVTALFSLYGY